MRATPRRDLGGRSPYEIVTGMRPQGPLETLLGKRSSKSFTPTEYVDDLRESLGETWKVLQEAEAAAAEERKRDRKRAAPLEERIGVGSYVFLEKPPKYLAAPGAEGSRRFAPLSLIHISEPTRPY